MLNDRKVSFSGIQPSGNLTIGNYLGALKNFPYYTENYKCFYCVVDMQRPRWSKCQKHTLAHTYTNHRQEQQY